jgi:hypothetical protein
VAAVSSAVALVTAVGAVMVLRALGQGIEEKNVARGETLRAEGKAENARQATRRAEEKTAEANRNAEAEKKAHDQADLQAYHALLRLADAQLQAGNARDGLEAFERVPRKHQDWAYHYLHRCAEGTLLSLRHPTGAAKVAYSPDGNHIASAGSDNTVRVRDARSSKLLAGAPPAAMLSAGYDPWADDFHRRTALTSLRHAAALQAATTRGDTFAAEFHRRRRHAGDNLRLLAWARLAAEQGESAALARPWQVSAAAVVGLGAWPTLAMGAAPQVTTALLHQEELRRAALLVHAAAVLPDSGIDASELVKLVQQCVEALALAHQRLGHSADAQEWQDRGALAESWEDQVLQARLLLELNTLRPPSPR